MRTLAAIALLVALCTLPAPSPAEAQWPPEKFENLQVLSQDIELRELVGIMRGFAGGLGVRCIHCHVGEDPDDLSSTEFASDTKATKRKAREMLRMTMRINNELLANVPDRSDPPIEVTCATCHHGLTQPVTIQSILTATAEADGFDAVVEKYQELRDTYFGSYSYDFRDFVLSNVAEAIASDRPEDALRLFEYNLELFPESVSTLFAKARFHQRQGDTAAVLRTYERALEIDPENSFFQRTVERLRAGEG